MSSAVFPRVDEVADGIYRLHTPLPEMNFSLNQYLIVDDEPLLFHTGTRRAFASIRDAVAKVMPVERLRYVAFSHVESDECGSLNEWLAAAPQAVPVCSATAAMVSMGDTADREPRPLADGERLLLGKRELTWLDTPHLPHGWDTGYLYESRTQTLLCGDIFAQPGAECPPIVTGDLVGPCEESRMEMDDYSYTAHARVLFDKLIATKPRTLACMHGSAWEGDGARMLEELAQAWVAASRGR